MIGFDFWKKELSRPARDKIELFYKIFDSDKNGQMDREELTRMLTYILKRVCAAHLGAPFSGQTQWCELDMLISRCVGIGACFVARNTFLASQVRSSKIGGNTRPEAHRGTPGTENCVPLQD